MTPTQLQQRTGLSPLLYAAVPREDFKWRTKQGGYSPVKNMGTNHLVNVIKMIWNNTAPVELRFYEGRLYNFSSTYTPEYFAEAVVSCLHELGTRKDMTAPHRRVLETIHRHLNPDWKPPIEKVKD